MTLRQYLRYLGYCLALVRQCGAHLHLAEDGETFRAAPRAALPASLVESLVFYRVKILDLLKIDRYLTAHGGTFGSYADAFASLGRAGAVEAAFLYVWLAMTTPTLPDLLGRYARALGQRLDTATDPDAVERHLAPVRRLYWLASHDQTLPFVMDPGASDYVFEVLTIDWPARRHGRAALNERTTRAPTDTMNTPTKNDLLIRYSQETIRQPRALVQFEGFFGGDPRSKINAIPCDEDGDSILGGTFFELANKVPVRVEILVGTRKEVAARILRKMLEWVEDTPGHVLCGAADAGLSGDEVDPLFGEPTESIALVEAHPADVVSLEDAPF